MIEQLKHVFPKSEIEPTTVYGELINLFKTVDYYPLPPKNNNGEIKIDFVRPLKTGKPYPRYHIDFLISRQSPGSEFLMRTFHFDKHQHEKKATKGKIKKEIKEINKLISELQSKEKTPLQTRLLLLLNAEISHKRNYTIITKRTIFIEEKGDRKKLKRIKTGLKKFNWRIEVSNMDVSQKSQIPKSLSTKY